MKLKYAVIGTGAIGGFYGGKLANAGEEVHFLFRSDYEQVKNHGLQVNSVNGDFTINPINAYCSTLEMPVCDVVLVGLKSTANHLLPEMLKPIIHEQSIIVLIQNGLGLEEILSKQIPNNSIAGAMAFICSQKNSPGVISHIDYGSINLGLHKGDNDLLKNICSDLVNAGIKARIVPDLNEARWHKLVWNVPFNGMSVVMDVSTDEMLRNHSMCRLLQDIMDEVVMAAKYCGVNIAPDFSEKMINMTLEMTPYAPSMKLDYDHKRPMEIAAIYSAPIAAAEAVGYKMKKTRMLEQQLHFIADRNNR